jgi:ubiquinone biosynthesis protein COQ9
MAHDGVMSNPLHQDWATDAEARLLDAAIPLAGEHGWNARLVAKAGAAAGLSEADLELLLPKGRADLAALLSRRHDARALAELIHTAVEARIEAAVADEAALKAALTYLAHPAHAPVALRLGWDTADKLWRWAGDTATDENHYSKRVILGTVLATTLAARLVGGHEHARKHLTARIDQVMAFEKWKATGAPKPSDWGKTAAAFLGRMRYGARAEPAAKS